MKKIIKFFHIQYIEFEDAQNADEVIVYDYKDDKGFHQFAVTEDFLDELSILKTIKREKKDLLND